MTKIAFNGCYGGFSLSDAAIQRYLNLKGWKFTVTKEPQFDTTHYEVEGQERWYHRGIPRADPVLIQVIEEMGEAANGGFASLHITEVPSGTKYRIDEYDGMESVMTIDDYEWFIA